MREQFEQYLVEAMEKGASDVHLSVSSLPTMRVDGSLIRFGATELTPKDTEGLARAILNESQFRTLEEYGEVDLSHSVQEKSRFRVNVYKQRDTIGIAARVIPFKIPTIEQLGLPPVLKKIVRSDKGIVLVTGPTGSGKSSTLAAMIDYLNETTTKHIVTLEDPIEFLHKNKKCLIEQRQIGSDTKSFDSALRAALRQDPDVILVGEMRDLETVKAALTAAETGHLVLGTLHTQTAPSTIDRIIDSFPGEAQSQVRSQLANSLQAIISQRLVKRKDGGRVGALEILINNHAIQNLIRTEKIHQIKNVIGTNTHQGMTTLEQSVKTLLETGVVTEEVLFDLNISVD